MFYVLVYMYTLSSRVLSPHIKYTQISTIIMYYYIVLYIHVYIYIYIHIANQLSQLGLQTSFVRSLAG